MSFLSLFLFIQQNNPASQWGTAGSVPLPKPIGTWNVTNFVDVLKEVVPALNWTEVISSLDYPGFALRGIKALEVIVAAYRQATSVCSLSFYYLLIC